MCVSTIGIADADACAACTSLEGHPLGTAPAAAIVAATPAAWLRNARRSGLAGLSESIAGTLLLRDRAESLLQILQAFPHGLDRFDHPGVHVLPVRLELVLVLHRFE